MAWIGAGGLDRSAAIDAYLDQLESDDAADRRYGCNRYKVLMLDGAVLVRKTGAGALLRPDSRCFGAAPRRQEGSRALDCYSR
jgi:hypothetical protein